jgi:hypothetical protein
MGNMTCWFPTPSIAQLSIGEQFGIERRGRAAISNIATPLVGTVDH